MVYQLILCHPSRSLFVGSLKRVLYCLLECHHLFLLPDLLEGRLSKLRPYTRFDLLVEGANWFEVVVDGRFDRF
jgi:hypothetical protein